MKRIISIISLMCLLVCTTSIPCFADETTNLLIGGTATANSVKPGSSADYAIDGIATGTTYYWRTNSNSTAASLIYTLDIAMANAITFDKIDVTMVSSYFWAKWTSGSVLTVLAADNASFTNATTVATIAGSGAESYSATFKSVTAKYIRYSFKADSTACKAGLGVLEVGVYYTGTGSGTETVTNLAAGKTITTSSINSASWNGDKTVDGVTTTGWQTAGGDSTPTISVDFGEAVSFNEWSYTTMLSVGTTNCVNSFVLEAADDAEFTQNVKTLYDGGAIANSSTAVLGFDKVTARYFRFRVISRDLGSSFRIYEMAVYNAPVASVAASSVTPVVYVPYSGSVSQKANAILAYDAGNVKIGNSEEAVYTLDTTPTGISIDAATGDITVAAGAEPATLGVNAVFANSKLGTVEYNVTVSNTFDESISSNPAYIVPEPVFYNAEGEAATIATAASGKIKIMPVLAAVPQKLCVVAVTYTDAEKTKVSSVKYVSEKALSPFKYTDVDFDVTAADEGKINIFVWDLTTSITPVMDTIAK